MNVDATAYDCTFRSNVPTVDAAGAPLPNGTRFEVTWPGGVQLPPDHTEVANVDRADGASVQVVKEVYRG